MAHSLTEAELRAWSRRLAAREDALAADQAAFDEHVRAWEARAELFIERTGADLMDALRVVRAAFPMGITFEPWGPSPGGTVH